MGWLRSFFCVHAWACIDGKDDDLSAYDLEHRLYDRLCKKCGLIRLDVTERNMRVQEARERAKLVTEHAQRQKDKRLKALKERLEEMDRSMPTPPVDEIDLRIARELQQLEGK